MEASCAVRAWTAFKASMAGLKAFFLTSLQIFLLRLKFSLSSVSLTGFSRLVARLFPRKAIVILKFSSRVCVG
jgi:hypothetical protein